MTNCFERDFLGQMIRASVLTAGDTYIEVGVKDGESLEIARKANPRMQIIGVDPKPSKQGRKVLENETHYGVYSDRAARRMAKKGVSASSIFIDADHSYEWVKKDLESYWPLWNHKGFFAGHDFVKRGAKRYGVIPAVCEFFELEDPRKINRRFEVKDGLLFIYDKIWCYTEHPEKYEKVIGHL